MATFHKLHGNYSDFLLCITFLLECLLWENDPVADIVFLMDSSGSIVNPNPQSPESFPENYDSLRAFIGHIIERLEIGENAFRVGLVRFSNKAETIFPLNYYYNKKKMVGVVNNIPYVGGTTNTSGALRETLENQFKLENGDRPNAPNVAILITDGNPNVDELRTTSDAEAVRRAGIYLMAIGITSGVSRSMLAALASCPQRDMDTVFLTPSFDTLSSDLEAVVTDKMLDVVQKQCGDLAAGISLKIKEVIVSEGEYWGYFGC